MYSYLQPQSNLYLSDRLIGQDERLDSLSNLFEQLQVATVETCNPALDLLTFAESAPYFAVIMEKTSPKSGPYADIDILQEEAIGLVYLVDLARFTDDPFKLHAQELNIGIILEPFHRGKGYAHQVIEMVLEVAFETMQCHRVQAILPDHVAKDRAICLFTQMRFDHEGTRRRGFFSPMEHVYKDVTYMGMLDTDWMLRQIDRERAQRSGRLGPRSVWDELLSRHQREREELLNYEANIRHSGTRVRARAQTPTQSNFRMTEANDDDDEMGDEIDLDAASPSSKSELKEEETGWRTLPRGHESDPFATSSDSESDSISERSASPGGYFSAASSSGSAWDVVESSDLDSSSSSSDFGDEGAFEIVWGTSRST